MKSSHLKQVVTQDLRHDSAQLPYNAIPSTWLARLDIQYVTPMTFVQKVYKSKELEIAEKYSQAIDANSLEQLSLPTLKRVGILKQSKNELLKVLSKHPYRFD